MSRLTRGQLLAVQAKSGVNSREFSILLGRDPSYIGSIRHDKARTLGKQTNRQVDEETATLFPELYKEFKDIPVRYLEKKKTVSSVKAQPTKGIPVKLDKDKIKFDKEKFKQRFFGKYYANIPRGTQIPLGDALDMINSIARSINE